MGEPEPSRLVDRLTDGPGPVQTAIVRRRWAGCATQRPWARLWAYLRRLCRAGMTSESQPTSAPSGRVWADWGGTRTPLADAPT